MIRRFGAYLAYTRPLSIPVTLTMVLTGWLASPAHPRDPLGVLRDVLLLAFVYSFLMWGGSNAFNSAEDQDTGPVNLLPNPPPRPDHLGAFGIVLHVAGTIASAVFGPTCLALAAVASLVSIFYSWKGAPWPRGKEIPGVDNLINACGCGAGSFLYGWSASGAPLDSTACLLGLGWTVCLFGGMPTAQIFQLDPSDTAHTARNWTAWLGAARTLRLGSLLFLVHLAVIARLSDPGIGTALWAVTVVLAAGHSLWWSFSPFTNPYVRMLRQMTLLTAGQLAWAVGRF